MSSVPSHARGDQHLGKTLFQLTWPMIVGVLALMSYQLADSLFISMLGTEPLAALGFTIAIHQVFIGIQVGIGIAATALISRALGAGQRRRARELGGIVLSAGSLLMAVLGLLVWAMRDVLLSLLDADQQLWPLISQYWVPWLVSVWLGATVYFAYSIARAQGNTKLPGSVMLLSSLLNIAFDPLLIFVMGLGLPGAALASVAAFGVAAIIMAQRLWDYRWIRFRRASLSLWRALSQLSAIAGPAMLSQLMPGVAAMAATTIVAQFGAAAVGAWGLSTRLEFFSLVVVLGLTMSLPPLVARYLGAQETQLIERVVKLTLRFVLVFQLAIAAIWLLLSYELPQRFAADNMVSEFLHMWFISVPLSYGALGVCMLMVSVTNALGMPLRAVFISGLRLFAFYLPALWLGASLAGMGGVYAGACAGNFAAGLAAWSVYKRAMRHARLTPHRRNQTNLDIK